MIFFISIYSYFYLNLTVHDIKMSWNNPLKLRFPEVILFQTHSYLFSFHCSGIWLSIMLIGLYFLTLNFIAGMCQLIPEVVIHKLLSDIHCPILSCLFRQCFHGEQWSWLSSLRCLTNQDCKLHFWWDKLFDKYISKKRKNLKVH